MKLTDTQLLDMIEKHKMEINFRTLEKGSIEAGWVVWTDDLNSPIGKSPDFRTALHLAHTALVVHKLTT